MMQEDGAAKALDKAKANRIATGVRQAVDGDQGNDGRTSGRGDEAAGIAGAGTRENGGTKVKTDTRTTETGDVPGAPEKDKKSVKLSRKADKARRKAAKAGSKAEKAEQKAVKRLHKVTKKAGGNASDIRRALESTLAGGAGVAGVAGAAASAKDGAKDAGKDARKAGRKAGDAAADRAGSCAPPPRTR